MKRFTPILSALLMLSLLSCGKHSTPEQTVLNFYKATQQQEFEEALSYTNLADNERAQVIQVLEQTGMVIHEYKILNSNIEEGDSTAFVSLHLVVSSAFNPDTVSNDIEVPCVRVDNQWKVRFI